MSFCGLVPLFALGALVPGAMAPRKDRPQEPGPVPVVIRTKDDVVVGTDLRYENGVFRLRDGASDTSVEEAKVARISFVRGPGEEPHLPVVGLALRLAHYRRLGTGFMRWRFPMPEGIFILPNEPAVETFRRLAPKVHPPEAIATLCLEMAGASLKEGKAAAALDAMAAAEREASDPARAFVFGLMRAALLYEQQRARDGDEAVSRLRERYRDHQQDIGRFADGIHPGERPTPFPPSKQP